MIDEKLASIIIPTFNRSHRIIKTITSCFGQSYPHVEIIIIDDGSIDNTKNVIAAIKNKYDSKNKYIKYCYQKNSGACVARNTGIDIAKGGYIQFLDSDDIMIPQKLENQILKINNTNDPCAICDFEYVDSNGHVLKKTLNNGNIFNYIRKFRSVSIMTPLIKRSSLIDGIRWNPKLKRNQDMDFMFRYFLTIKKWMYTPGFFCRYYQHDDNQISDSYSLGLQHFELIKSFRSFYKNNHAYIPKENAYLVGKYTRKIFSLYLKNNVKKFLPEPVIKAIKSFG